MRTLRLWVAGVLAGASLVLIVQQARRALGLSDADVAELLMDDVEV